MADDTELDSNIKFFVKSHCGLIDAEFEEERKEFHYDTVNYEVGKLEKRGVLINNLIINNVESEFGSCIVEFGRTSVVDTGPIAISSGDIANVWYHDEEAGNKKTLLASGTIMQVGDTIKMSFDNSNPFNWEHEKYFIVKTLSEVTFKRMKKALQNILHHARGRCAMITKHLFGFAELRKTALHPGSLNERGELSFYNKELHKSQEEAVRFCLEQANFAVVHGPPGTGKTTVLIEVILHLVNTGHKVLVCAPSNIAVDTIVEKLDAIKSKIIRLGKTARMLESSKNYSVGAAMSSSDDASILRDVKNEMKQHQMELQNARPGAKPFLRHEIRELRKEFYRRQYKVLQDLLKKASVVLATLTSASDDGDLKNVTYEHFDVVIIDECSQAIEAACWIAIPRAPKLIVAGDHLQLPPTVKSKLACECGLSVSLMERAILRMGDHCFKLLTHQYRMNSLIMKWVSTFYQSKLVADESVAKCLLRDLCGVKETELTETPLLVVDTAGFDQMEREFQGSKCNECEADIVALLVKCLIDAGVFQNQIAVISPYTLQITCIKTKISNYPEVEVRTVDGFQGREKQAVIISLVRSNRRRELGFLSDKRRLNVAVSRAQCFLAVIGDSSTVKVDDTIRSLWTHIEEFGSCSSIHDYSQDIDALGLPVFAPYQQEIQPKRKKSRSKFLKGDQTIQSNNKEMMSVAKKASTHSLGSNKSSMEAFKNIQATRSKRDLRCKRKDEPTTSAECQSVEFSDPDIKEVTSSSEIEISDQKKDGESSKTKYARAPSKKNSKTKLKPQKSNISEDSDEDLRAIEKSRKRNTTCFMKSCRTSVKLYPQVCQHCHEVFCLAHILPEVHGCGEAAKRSARQNFRRSQPKLSEKERNIASQKLKQKISDLAAEKKRQTKK